jgi:hypothetical protein
MKGKTIPMNLSITIAFIVVCIIVGLFFYPRLKSPQTSPGSFVNIFIPFPQPLSLDTKKISESFSEQWGHGISFKESKNGYVVSESVNQLIIEVHNERLANEFVDILTSPFYGLDNNETQKLKYHNAYINLLGSGKPKENNAYPIFVAQVLLTLLREEGAIGFSNAAAQSYYPVNRFVSFGKKSGLQPEELYLLFVSVQQVNDQDGYWFHTHGLEQFNVPNLEIKFTDKEKSSYYQSVIENTSVYLIINGDIIKSENTLELMGDGVIFKAVLRRDQEFPTGMLTLTEKK